MARVLLYDLRLAEYSENSVALTVAAKATVASKVNACVHKPSTL